MTETVSGYVFGPADLKIGQREPGISAFMRIRNGEDFTEAAIESHIGHFDEIVAVYNQCSDATPQILARLAQRHGPKLRVFHYADRVFPPGTDGHVQTPPDSPASVVNYSNFALARTTRQIVTKLDDDHVAMRDQMGALAKEARSAPSLSRETFCYSGLNLARNADGGLALPAEETMCGNGDHWFVRLTPENFFVKDERFETFRHGSQRRRFRGFTYWHLKYLKRGGGFSNYELGDNPQSRFARKQKKRQASDAVDLATAAANTRPAFVDSLLAPFDDKRRLLRDRARRMRKEFAGQTIEDVLTARTPGWRQWFGDG